jgi:Post-segregation antitoxin (ccd killing mechanism protein) encoded by the F plasmid
MVHLYDRTAPKKPTSLTINSDLLVKAKDLQINISAVLESALEEAVKQKKRNDWIEQNSESISGYNKVINDFGIFSDGLRAF